MTFPSIIGANENLVLSSYYNPPNTKIDLNFFNYIFNISEYSLLIGDLNSHHQLWNSKLTNISGRLLYDCLLEKDLVLLNDDSPTYWPVHNLSSSTIDLAIATEPLSKHVNCFSVTDHLSSDHLKVMVELNYSGPAIGAISDKSPDKTIIKSINIGKFKEELVKIFDITNYTQPENKTSLDAAANDITLLINTAVSNSTFTKTINVNKNKYLLLPPHIVKLIKAKRKARRASQKYKTLLSKCEYYRLDKIVKNEIINFKKNKWQNFCSSINDFHVSDAKLWKGLNSVDKSASSSKNIRLFHEGNLVSENSKITKIFAEYLEQVFVNHESVNSDADHITHVEEVADSIFINSNHNLSSDQQLSTYELTTIIKDIRAKGAPGPDNITNKIITELPLSVISRLVDIFNASISLSHIALTWKNANVTMVPKPQKNLKCVESYRPISLLNTLSKLLERVIKNRLECWIDRDNILSNNQCGFRRNHSTREHLLRLTQDCQQAFNKNMAVGALFFDFEKAFDRVWIKGLIYKLSMLGIPTYLGCWLKNYLSNRSFQVCLNGSRSSSKPIQASVPQGSILGPTLFNIYIDDINKNFINSKLALALFADDVSSWTASPYPQIIEKIFKLHPTESMNGR